MSAVTDILLAPDVRPFAIAAAIMATLGGLEVLTMIVGFSISELIGSDFALEAEHHDGVIGGIHHRPPRRRRRQSASSSQRSSRPSEVSTMSCTAAPVWRIASSLRTSG